MNDQVQAVFNVEANPLLITPEENGSDNGSFVFQGEIDVSG